ncbi:hypothetical protein LUZ61_015806 [Rhynchospora tenuis]|uniref:GRF-type domain-containing protein n=1 Tax=Rhynchospora tenuis TaxID=198213 RepID=A0AAD6EJ65_9POAL|nr:hypothetical protein LUZ61_015806 [Rhynchospora tenuis]
MHRRSRDGQSVSHSASSSVGPQPSRNEGLPLVPCPDCGVTVKKFTSRTDSNPNRLFYKCTNQHTRCSFWMWDNEYESYVTNANIVIPSLDCELLATLEAQLENLTDEFKKKSQYNEQQMEELSTQLENLTDEFKNKSQYNEQKMKELVASLDKMKLHNTISAIVIVTLLILVIALLLF